MSSPFVEKSNTTAQQEKYKDTLSLALKNGEIAHIDTAAFNKILLHIYELLKYAVDMYVDGVYALPVFLAITAMEEKAKAEVLIYRPHTKQVQEEHQQTCIDENTKVKRGKDVLYDHKSKHRLAPSPVLSIGTRLPRAIGDERLTELLMQSCDKGFCRERENALYFQVLDTKSVITPKEVYSKEQAKEFILFAIEIVDDGLIGYTDFSISEISPALDDLWNLVINNG